ncbi:MAG: glycosyltransferase [Alphaproteobacteria bacterium]|nr:glycosyltransferase [Alphaproteobacteria bacterium]
MPKISIIIPVYNVEKYLRCCLDSVLNQTFQDFEVICVNDGSTDECPHILDEYAQKDKRIKILNKTNSGYGHSMNEGLAIATGMYIGIVESDDFIETNMFERLYNVAEEYHVDVVKSNFYEYYEQTNTNIIKNLIPDECLNKVLCPYDYPSVFRMMPSIWSALYRKEFLDKNNIRFVESAGASYQDTGFNFKVWAMAKRAYFIKDTLLHYRSDNVNSSVKSCTKVFCVCDEFQEIESYLKTHNKYEKYKFLAAWIKYHIYMWNWKRLKSPAKNEFFVVFVKQLQQHYKHEELLIDLFGKKHLKRALRICLYPKIFSLLYKMQHFPNAISNKINYLKRKSK